MTQPLVSVIVPIYNVADLLGGCLDSILNQTYQNFEIICVDDGATDNSGQIADSYAQKDKRITVIHQQNKGLSGARNSGLVVAKGEYVTFCDSDDYYHPLFLEKMMSFILQENADVVTCSLIHTKEKNTGKYDDLSSFVPTVRICDNPIMDFLNTSCIPTGVHIKLYRREALGDLQFVDGIYFEDIPFTTLLMMQVKKVVSTNYPLYYYYTNPNSIMRTSFNVKKVMSYIRLIQHISEKTAQIRPELSELVRKKVLNRRFKMMVNQAIRKQKNKTERITLFNEIQKQVKPLFEKGIISYDGLKPHHRLTLFLLLKCKTSHPARWVMTLI